MECESKDHYTSPSEDKNKLPTNLGGPQKKVIFLVARPLRTELFFFAASLFRTIQIIFTSLFIFPKEKYAHYRQFEMDCSRKKN